MRDLLHFASLALVASALHSHIRPRADIDPPTVQQIEDTESDTSPAPTTDGSAGIGAEFESVGLYFTSAGCSLANTQASKGKTLGGRSGTNWVLTADTSEAAGRLSAEYILDGTQIKVGSGAATTAGNAVDQDLVNWSPACGTQVNVQDSVCNPWTVAGIRRGIGSTAWAPQITTSMPLEAIYSLWKEQFINAEGVDPNILDGIPVRAQTSFITKAHFQHNSNGINAAEVTDDVLGFCTLVMSYAKAATTLQPGSSPKIFTTFMPRTEFNTIFQQVVSKVRGDLFKLFDSLACYTTQNPIVLDQNGDPVVVLDTNYCTGTMDNPVSNGNFANLNYVSNGQTLNIQTWITGIGAGSPSPDGLTTLDKQNDGSIGNLNTNLEQMYNPQRSQPVPLFEFRDLNSVTTGGIGQFMTNVDQAIQALHDTFAIPP